MLPEKDIALRQREGERIARVNAHSKETLRVGVLSTFNVGLIEPFLRERWREPSCATERRSGSVSH